MDTNKQLYVPAHDFDILALWDITVPHPRPEHCETVCEHTNCIAMYSLHPSMFLHNHVKRYVKDLYYFKTDQPLTSAYFAITRKILVKNVRVGHSDMA